MFRLPHHILPKRIMAIPTSMRTIPAKTATSLSRVMTIVRMNPESKARMTIPTRMRMMPNSGHLSTVCFLSDDI